MCAHRIPANDAPLGNPLGYRCELCYAAPLMRSKQHDILLVEDHADTAFVLAKLLRSFGHRVQTAESCQTARRLFQTNPDVDVLLLDLGLPDGDGCDLLRELHQIRKIPAIAVTGYANKDDIERSQAAGFVAHITKPFALDQLTATLTNLKLQTPVPPNAA
jgi:CheY-like chemotaxis protein